MDDDVGLLERNIPMEANAANKNEQPLVGKGPIEQVIKANDSGTPSVIANWSLAGGLMPQRQEVRSGPRVYPPRKAARLPSKIRSL